ncbi:MAG TPA: protein kinase, partial [Thermoanaerobaculia bacterium]|nr:protein kinase [Thermoanaerobaculia bacterium]
MPLARGARLGPYLIDASIGAGGMGHVYRATDTRLGRAVAIKVLPDHRLNDPQLRLRFEREARALSSLSHPNLCPVFDVGEVDNGPYLVMELLEGVTLRERLDASPLAPRKALAFGSQIAAGLAAAHAKGVVHRDLKPENIFVTPGDLLKILDFGLATTTTAANQLATEPGMVMGTAYYMSPEQVRGLPLDARSDMFSLGVVLFEMLTGQVPFSGRSAVETMNSVLVDEPADLLPEGVDALVRRCLEKDPEQRFTSARDLMFALDAASKSVPGTATPAPVRAFAAPPIATPNLRKRAAILAFTLAAIVAAALLSRRSFEPTFVEPPRLRTLTSSGRDSAPAASPDGRLIAFVSTRDGQQRVWLEQLADGTEAAVTAGPDDSAPRFGPDGSVLLFTRSENGISALYRVGIVGGEPRKLIDNAFDGDWSPDGTRIAFIRNRAAGPQRFTTLCVAPVDGGAVQEIVASTDDEYSAPRWSPDGAWIAVTRNPRGTKPGSLILVDPV